MIVVSDNTAKSAGMRVIGTLGILIEAGLVGHLDFHTAIDRLWRTTSFYASKGLIEAAKRIYHERRAEE